jgi:hypothetical protein
VDNQDLKNLKKRYLIWLYKTTKEALDKIERKFTQLEIDNFILKELRKEDKDNKLKKSIDDLEIYIRNKEKEGLLLKFENKEVSPDCSFLNLKLKTIEKAIIKELGKNVLQEVKVLYEIEMIERILKSREH